MMAIALLEQQYGISNDLGLSITSPALNETEALAALHTRLGDLGVGEAALIGLSGYIDMERRFGESSTPVALHGAFFRQAFGMAVHGVLLRESTQEEVSGDLDMASGTAWNLLYVMEGAKTNGAYPRYMIKAARRIIMDAMKQGEEIADVDKVRTLQSVMDQSGMGGPGNAIHDLVRLVRSVKERGANIFDPALRDRS